MKCQVDAGQLTSVGVPTSSSISRNSRTSARKFPRMNTWTSAHKHYTEVGTGSPQAIGLVDRLRQEWDMLRGSVAAGGISTCSLLTKDELIKAWVEASGWAGSEFKDLIVQSIADVFLKVDLARNGSIDEVEWLHYCLLEQQAPSFHALSQVNEKLLNCLKEDPEILQRLNGLFLSSCGSTLDAQLTGSQMRNAVVVWVAEQRRVQTRNAQLASNGVLAYLEEMLARDEFEEDELLSYYDFMNCMLGRQKVKVQLYQYDLSKGSAKWLSPLLVGKQLDGIWHTSIVAYGSEFWFGGKLLKSPPGESVFGAPTMIIDLPEQTMRTEDEFVSYMVRVLAPEFTQDTYDILTHNCNHFTDAACLFLLNSHIPADVLTQPELVMGSWTMQLLRPVLNRALGNLEDSSAAKELDRAKEEQSPTVSKERDTLIGKGSLVVWEHEEGWTRIGRVVCQCIDTSTYVLKWLDVHTGELHVEIGVDRSRMQRLESKGAGARQRRPSDASVAGTFGARYHCFGAEARGTSRTQALLNL